MPKREFTTEAQRHREGRRRQPLGPAHKISLLKSSMFKFLTLCLCVSVVLLLSACSHKPVPNTLVMIIESSPLNLDPRVGVDAQSQRIDELIFDPAADARSSLQHPANAGRAMGDSRSADLRLSSAPRCPLSQWSAAHVARREVDFRLAHQRQNPQPQGEHVRFGQPHRHAGRLHGHLSPEAAVSHLCCGISQERRGSFPTEAARTSIIA